MVDELLDGFDCSNYGRVPTPATALALRHLGYTFAIVGTQSEPIARSQLEVFRKAGFGLGLYLYPYYDAADSARVSRTLRLASDFSCSHIFDDVEWDEEHDGPPPPHDKVCAGIESRTRAYSSVAQPGIYSSESQWPRMTGGHLSMGHLPLMSAYYYNDRHRPHMGEFRPYGGWIAPLIWQWHDTTTVAGFSVDLNIAPTRFWQKETTLKNDLVVEGPFLVLYHDDVPIRRWGGTDGSDTTKGRESWNFGGTWWWVRHFDDNGQFRETAWLSTEEGD